jgi:hypothetical protein
MERENVILVIAFAFGTPATLPQNREIAEMAILARVKEKDHPRVHVVTQLDLACLEDSVLLDYLHFVEEEEGNPPPTYYIANEAYKMFQDYDIERIRVVAARPHLKRAVRDVRKVFGSNVEILMPFYPEPIYREPYKGYFSWFNKNSTQKRTQGYLNWIVRERLLRNPLLFPLYKRKSLEYPS